MSNQDDWNAAIKMNDLPAPAAAGTKQQYVLKNLSPSTSYYATMRVIGDNGNESKFSAQLHLETADTGRSDSFTMMDFQNTMHSTDEWAGNKVTILNFWGVWCGWCVREMPHLKLLNQNYKDSGVVIVGLNWGDSYEEACEYINDNGIDWLNLDAPDSVMREYHVSVFPTSVFLDSTGSEIGRMIGYKEYQEWASIVTYLLQYTSGKSADSNPFGAN